MKKEKHGLLIQCMALEPPTTLKTIINLLTVALRFLVGLAPGYPA